tara:strand:- start:177 stop:935 length:759 start_codon:yes stop_codon:yes gene_type:complete
MATTKVTRSVITSDAISGAEIADDAIDSEHYAAGSIDTAHIADNQITLAKMAGGTDGQIITYDASGDPVAVGPGSDGQVLTSTGAGSPPAFENAAAGGKCLQVVQTPFTGTGSSTAVNPTFSANIFTGTITPSSTSSKVLIFVSLNMSVASNTYNCGARLVRGTTVIGSTPDSPGSNRHQVFAGGRNPSSYSLEHYTINYLDSPSSTSAVVYGVQISSQSGGTAYVNQTGNNSDSQDQCRAVSHICLMEIGA